MKIFNSLIYYENKHNVNFPNDKIKVIDKIGKYIYCETEFGICKKCVGDIGKYSFGICSAINKTQFFINKANKIHNNKYDYSLVNFINMNTKVRIICLEHGEFEQNPNSHLHKCGCKKCGQNVTNSSRKFTKDDFINKANLIHNFKYNYSKLQYTTSNKKVLIICPIHGEFKQVSNSHLQGYGCPKCGFEYVGNINANNPTGWTYSNWIKSAKDSKKFDSFKVYIIKCWNEEEEFYKIGRTFLTIDKRFSSKNAMPYKYKIVKIFKGDSNYIFNLEYKLKNDNKNNKYLPKIKFNGVKECFNKIEEYDE